MIKRIFYWPVFCFCVLLCYPLGWLNKLLEWVEGDEE